MFLKKSQPGNAPGYSWTEKGQVLEVEDDFARELLSIKSADFSVAEPIEYTPEPEMTLAEQDEAEHKRKAGRPPLHREKTART